MDTLIVTHVTIAPFKGPAQNDFRYNFQTGFDLKSIIDKYNGTDFTVLIIADIVSVGNVTLTQPYFFDIRELNEKKVNGFIFPPETCSGAIPRAIIVNDVILKLALTNSSAGSQ